MKLIAAVDSNWGIGKNCSLLASIPEDMKFFRESTRNHVLVMGHKTLLSFPGSKPLPARLNIVMSRSEKAVKGAVVCDSTGQLLALLQDFSSDDIFVIGGGMIYSLLLPYCETAYITKMQFDGGADAFFPNLDEDPSWQIVSGSEEKEHEGLRYSFVTYQNSAVQPLDFKGQSSAMSDYFKKAESREFDLAVFYNDSGNEERQYRKELLELLFPYFRPLEKGVTAAEVAAFLSEGEGSFEEFLRKNHFLTAQEDFDALAKRCSGKSEIRKANLRGEDLELFKGFTETNSIMDFFE